MILDTQTMGILAKALEKLEQGFADLPEVAPKLNDNVDAAALETVLLEVAGRMQDNYPYMHPYYAGQMLKPPHPVARLAYSLALFINPNNHALDGGIASSAMEKEAVAEIAKMFGFQNHLGHLTSGGTMANLEAIWVASKLKPGKLVVASKQAHYTHSRITGVLDIPYAGVDTDNLGRMSLSHLEDLLKAEEIGTVVVTLGTTSIGSVDQLPQILELRKKHGFRVHIDSAYGGYFKLVDNLDEAAASSYELICQADSIVVDPHKHGLQPYGCGCVIFKDPACGALYKHDSPYTYFSSNELHLGEISLECSRAGASAVALWATQRLLPLVKGGEFANGLRMARQAGLTFYEKLKADNRFIVPLKPELDIVVYAVKAPTASASSKLAKAIFDQAAKQNLHLALAALPQELFKEAWPGLNWDEPTVTCLRSCLMKPEHLTYIDEIWGILSSVTESQLLKTAV